MRSVSLEGAPSSGGECQSLTKHHHQVVRHQINREGEGVSVMESKQMMGEMEEAAVDTGISKCLPGHATFNSFTTRKSESYENLRSEYCRQRSRKCKGPEAGASLPCKEHRASMTEKTGHGYGLRGTRP